MKLLRYLMPVAVACGITATASAAEFSSVDEFNERDFEAVTDFIKTKRMVPLADKGCDLMISGDIRVEWENIKEKHAGVNRRGRAAESQLYWNNGAPYGSNQFDVEFNLMIDYKAGCTWAVAHLEFDNNAGIDVNNWYCDGFESKAVDSGGNTANAPGDPYGCHGSGSNNNLALRKAYFGYNVFEECGCRLDIEVGRRHFYDAFDSRVQFRSRFDGVLFRYSNDFECTGDFYANVGFFVIDDAVDHWGWVAEVGLLDICDYGFDLKYSYIDWAKDGCNRCHKHDPYGMSHKVHQLTAAYNFDPEWLCSRAKIYGAVLYNHDAKKSAQITKDKDWGWYVGFLVGDVRCEGDWSFDINYQWVEANVIPDCDVSGIGRGNARGVPITVNNAHGNTNFKGWRMEALYALTDNLGINPSWEYSNEEDAAIGGKHTYSKWELQLIYAF